MQTSLKILLIQQSKTLALNIEPQILDDVWDGLQLDPYIKYLICRNADGFYDFEAGGPPSPAGTATSQTLVQSYFVGVRGSYMLTWSFVPETRVDFSDTHWPARVVIGSRGHDSHLQRLPWSSPDTGPRMHWSVDRDVDVEISQELSAVLDVELRTGYSP